MTTPHDPADQRRIRRLRTLAERNGYHVQTVTNRSASRASEYGIWDAAKTVMMRFGVDLDEVERWVTATPVDQALIRSRMWENVERHMLTKRDDRSEEMARLSNVSPVELSAALADAAARVAQRLDSGCRDHDRAHALWFAARLIDHVEPLHLEEISAGQERAEA